MFAFSPLKNLILFLGPKSVCQVHCDTHISQSNSFTLRWKLGTIFVYISEELRKFNDFLLDHYKKRACFPYMDYSDWLDNLQPPSLEYRRIIFDLVICIKIIYKLVDLSVDNFFCIPNLFIIDVSTLKSWGQFRYQLRSAVRHNFFSKQVIPTQPNC